MTSLLQYIVQMVVAKDDLSVLFLDHSKSAWYNNYLFSIANQQ